MKDPLIQVAEFLFIILLLKTISKNPLFKLLLKILKKTFFLKKKQFF